MAAAPHPTMDPLTVAPCCAIDHIVLLVSTDDFDNPPVWLSHNFTILEGGVHTGQASRNKLIVFADGTYLELFNWFGKPPADDAQDQPMKVWANKAPGLIDFALTSTPPETIESHFKDRVRRLKEQDGDCDLGVTYSPPEPGGRTTTDGIAVRWMVSRPEFYRAKNTPDQALFPNGRIDAPFFCYDVTSRSVRVPFDDAVKTAHPCGAVRLVAVEILVPRARWNHYIGLYGSILGASARVVDELGRPRYCEFPVGLPVGSAGFSAVRMRADESEEDVAWLKKRGVGIRGLVFALKPGGEAVEYRLGVDGAASTVLLQRT